MASEWVWMRQVSAGRQRRGGRRWAADQIVCAQCGDTGPRHHHPIHATPQQSTAFIASAKYIKTLYRFSYTKHSLTNACVLHGEAGCWVWLWVWPRHNKMGCGAGGRRMSGWVVLAAATKTHSPAAATLQTPVTLPAASCHRYSSQCSLSYSYLLPCLCSWSVKIVHSIFHFSLISVSPEQLTRGEILFCHPQNIIKEKRCKSPGTRIFSSRVKMASTWTPTGNTKEDQRRRDQVSNLYPSYPLYCSKNYFL